MSTRIVYTCDNCEKQEDGQLLDDGRQGIPVGWITFRLRKATLGKRIEEVKGQVCGRICLEAKFDERLGPREYVD